MDNFTLYNKSSTFQRPKTLLKDSNVINSSIKSGSLKFDLNSSNKHIIRKSSFKQKFLSIFKNYSKTSQENSPNDSYTTDDNNSTKNYQNRKKIILERSQSHTATFQSKRYNKYKTKRAESQENHLKRLDLGDMILIDKYFIHPLNGEILKYITELHCLPIKLSPSLINQMGNHLSNNAIIPFISTIPGILGIENHGNTCYVNVIIQCLAHIDSVAEYFSTKDYLQHVQSNDHLSNSMETVTSGSVGASSFDVMVGFSYLLQSLWQLTYHNKISMRFCKLLTMHKSEFSLDSQQDAHELLLFILNLLHDNLTSMTTTSSPTYKADHSYIYPVSVNGVPTGESSFIYQRFRGWLSNEIVCPECRYTRKTLDQILSLNLQIPKQSSPENPLPPTPVDKSLFYIVVINSNQIPEKHAMEINKTTTIGDVRQCIADRLGCTKYDIVITEVVRGGFGNLYSDSEEIMGICKTNTNLELNISDGLANGLYATHIPNQVVDVDALPIDSTPDNIMTCSKNEKEFPDNQSFIRILLIHVERNKDDINEVNDEPGHRSQTNEINECSSSCHGDKTISIDSQYSRFTNILTVQASRQTKISLLRHSLSQQMFTYFNLRNITKVPKPQFIIGSSHLISEMDLPLTHVSVNNDLKYSMELCGEESAHIRLLVVWPKGTTEKLRMYKRRMRENLFDNPQMHWNYHKIYNHHSISKLKLKLEKENAELESSRKKGQNKINITDCLREFFSLDTLSITESWKCPNCQTSQPARTEIRIEEAPEVLILMLKRFSKQKNNSTENLTEKRNLNTRNEQNRKHFFNQSLVSEDYKLKNGTHTKSNSPKSRDSLNKLDCLINYPLQDLDLSPYMENVSSSSDYLYDLVGVVNHRGSLFNGHYVAICRNSIDDKWRLYDDDRVTEISASEVVQSDAYILFYKRQTEQPESNLNLHWSYKRLSFPEKIHRNYSPSPPLANSKYYRFIDKEPRQFLGSYSTLPLSINNNHNSRYSLSTQYSPDLIEGSISSPIIALSELSIISKLNKDVGQHNGVNGIIDNSKTRSKIIDVDSLSLESILLTDVDLLKTTSSDDSCTKSINDDSGAAMSQDFSRPMLRKKHNQSIDTTSKDECYNSFSTTPSTSSPVTSNAY